ncbi:unnamed protein product [Paramecium octaurelia]|uniref:WD40-repeat-containing domain n=1 Tax=Paramecium octaurelia TaxID=43137 RepID=A0A8S1WAU1_PAROT|nr:unnamed protein product [Paramecium octaurelia]
MVDINKESAFTRRFGCSKCIEESIKSKIDKFDQIKSLESFWALWEVISKDNKSLIQETIKKMDEHTKSLSTFNNIILTSIVEVTHFFQQKLLDQLKVFDVEPQYLTEKDLYQIAENLSNKKDYLDNFKSQQEDYYISYLREIQNILDQNNITIIQKVKKHNLSLAHQQINIKITLHKKSFFFSKQKGIIGILISFCIITMINSNLSIEQIYQTLKCNQKIIKSENEVNSYSNESLSIDYISQTLKTNQKIIKNEKEVNEFSYQLMQSNIQEIKLRCQLFAFNTNNTIMIAGCEKQIQVFQFADGNLYSRQTISSHNHNLTALYHMKNSEQFVSGDMDGTILIFKYNSTKNKWEQQLRKEKYHKGRINKIIMNNNENLIITGGNDSSIMFLKFEKDIQNQQKVFQLKSQVLNLILNEVEDELISSDNEGTIYVIKKLYQDNWNVSQNIITNPGFKLTFIDTNQFVYQSNKGDLQVFKLHDGKYKQIQTLDLKGEGNQNICHIPQVFIKQKSILISINYKQINIIKKNQNGDLEISKSIELSKNPVYGGLSNNGQYLITLDEKDQGQLQQFVQQN